MTVLTLTGSWDGASDRVLALLRSEFKLEFFQKDNQPHDELISSPELLLAAISQKSDIPDHREQWFAWLRENDPDLTLAAYQSGARAVFPPDISPDLLAQAIRQSNSETNQPEISAVIRSVKRGSPIFLEAGSVLTVLEGVVATMMVHEDGAHVLLGLTGAGQILIGHPADECFIEILAHTPVVVSIQPWELAASRPGFNEKLRSRLQYMEGWSARQARPYLNQRVMGILSLLAEQFGSVCSSGTLIDVRLTHAQMAAAVGANRSTVTRVLGELSTLGKIKFEGTGKSGRIILCESIKPCHFCPKNETSISVS